MVKLVVGATLMLMMLCRPEAAANGAREGLRQWYYVVAPSLFPFMALMPLMTCPEAARLYDRALGGIMRRLFGLPGSAASPMIVGMIAGSPAGCAAAVSVAGTGDLNRGQLERIAASCCGLSPAFFISAVGAGMLGDAAAGHLLLRSQVITQILMLVLTGFFYRDKTPVGAKEADQRANPVLSIINVAGYMTLFGAIAGAIGHPWVQLALDVTAGSRLLCEINLEQWMRLAALSVLAGYGGLCICAQNIGVLRHYGISTVKFVVTRCGAGLIAAGLTVLQLQVRQLEIPLSDSKWISVSCIMALFLALPVILRLKKTFI